MRNQYKFLILSIVLLSACSKNLDLKNLEFDATAEKATFAVADTARFNFTGNPDVITFYSGEVGSRYEFRKRTSDTSSNLQLQFSTSTTTATNGTLSLLVSNNLSGAIDATTIAAATWTDITNRAVLATGTATVASGNISLSDFAQQRKPVYIAFRYVAAAAAIQKRWTITGLTLNHVLTDNTYTIANMSGTAPSPGWLGVDIKNTAINWTSALVITGATTAATAVETEDWIVAGPIDLSRVFPDQGLAIKTIVEGMNKFPYKYKYAAAGTYNAVFVASNVNRDAEESSVKTIPVTVQ
jgi:Domain of unknown function (DUF5017)